VNWRKRERLLLALADGAQRFKELLAASGLSDTGLIKALNDLQANGIVVKLPDGRYSLTEKGREWAKRLKAEEVFERVIREKGVEKVVDALLKLQRGQS